MIVNRLAQESSPYLLQHKTNPVDWYPWCEEAFDLAQQQGKLVLISIGYSACHWCHVMEHECFEDEEVAKYMNAHFVNIKVDREERPDIDQIYMSAVQLMTQRGGWPLNCFVLPNGQPFYGGTYFPKDQWLHIMKQLVYIQNNEPEKLTEYAAKLTEGVANAELLDLASEKEFSEEHINQSVSIWQSQFDWKEGGMNRAPKFPMPNNYLFLQGYAEVTDNANLSKFVDLTLTKMARGGIYDQIGGGFCRYSVDELWKVPHFEKMLYDNGQLLSLYSLAYSRTGNPEYKFVVDTTIEFLRRELLAPDRAFYSALDADSEGEEGKFYVWTRDEIVEALPASDAAKALEYYNLNQLGYWEESNSYILMRTSFEGSEEINQINHALLQERTKRTRPGLDDKILTSWNAMTVAGLVDAARVFDRPEHLKLASNCMEFILSKLTDDSVENGKLFHTYQHGTAKVQGFLEDYAFVATALTRLFEETSEEKYLHEASRTLNYAIDAFFEDANGLFNFTDKYEEQLIARKQEVSDNVIPASNSEIARALWKCGNYLGNTAYLKMARQMLSNVWEFIPNYISAHSNWSILAMEILTEHSQIVVSGPDSLQIVAKIKSMTHPSVPVLKCVKESELPVFKGRFSEEQTHIFVCTNNVCQAPVNSVEEAMKLI